MDLDVTSLLEAALQQGIWAALYIYLFFRIDWMRWKNDMQVDKKRRLESLLFLYLKSKKKGNQYGKKYEKATA